MKNKKCVILSGGRLGDSTSYRDALEARPYIICADGGARHAWALGVKPDLVVGDFDTLTTQEIKTLREAGVDMITYATDKDLTDTHLALKHALNLGFHEIELWAALGSRLDHSLANIMLLAAPEASQASVRLLDERQDVRLVRQEIKLEGTPGDTLSLLPLSAKVTGVQTTGLKYHVPHGVLELGVPIGVSNILTASQVTIRVEEGQLLVIHQRVQESSQTEG